MSSKKQTEAQKHLQAAIADENVPSVPFWRTMLPFLAQHRRGVIVAILCSFVTGIAVAVQPFVIKYIVDEGIGSALNNERTLDAALKYILSLCILYIALGFMRLGVWRIGFLSMLRAQEGALFSLRSKFFYHVQHMCMRFSDNNASGEIFNYIMGSPMGHIKTFLDSIFMSVPFQVVTLTISLFALLSYDPSLTLVLGLMIAIMAVIKILSNKRIRNRTSEYLQVEKAASSYITDILHGIDAIKMYSIEQQTGEKFDAHLSAMKERGVKHRAAILFENAKPEFVQYAGTAVIYFIGAYYCLDGRITTGMLYAFLSSMGSILGIVLSWFNVSLQKSSAEIALNKIMNIINQKSSTPDLEPEKTHNVEVERESSKKNGRPCISLENVNFSYDERNEIFHSLSCDIKYNESVAFVGSSGSGKSTLTKLIMRLYEVNGGSVKVHGKDVRSFSTHDLRLCFGVVPQNPFIFHDTVWDNIRVARPDASNFEIIRAMEIAHVHEFVNELPQGWATVIGDGALNLSGGQKQRIAIARAILKNPDILIFDEATSALDNISERHIQQAMEDLMKTHTVIIVAHRLSTIRNVDRILVFDRGEIVQTGTYDELAESDGLFRELLEGPSEEEVPKYEPLFS